MSVVPGTVALIANGMIRSYTFIQEKIHTYERIIAIDGGLRHCREMGLTPDLLVGDLDSVPQEFISDYPLMEIRKFPKLKDETDLELGLKIANIPGTKKMTLFAALGDRTDHSLANLFLILQYPMLAYMETEKELVFAFQHHVKVESYPGQTVSLFPLGQPAEGVTTKGLQWELNNINLNQSFFSISNIALSSNFEVTIKNGFLICCLQK